MPAPHRLTSLAAARPDLAAAELRALLDAHRGIVSNVARALDLDRSRVHALIARLDLAEWLESAWPANDRPRGGRPDLGRRSSSEQAAKQKSTRGQK